MLESSGGDWKEAARRERDEASDRIEGKAAGAGDEGGKGAGDPDGKDGQGGRGGKDGKGGKREGPVERREGEEGAAGDEVPPANLAMLVMRLAAEARFHLHLVPEEVGVDVPEGPPDLKLARFVIDLVGMLETKTQGNRDDQEEQLLRAVIDDLRLAFVEASRKDSSA